MTTDKKTSKYQTQEKVENNKNEILSNNSEVISNQIEYPAGDKIDPRKRAKESKREKVPLGAPAVPGARQPGLV